MNRKYTPEAHVHHGITYRTYDNDGAIRCEWHSCTYNVYNSFDEPEEVDANWWYQEYCRITDELAGKDDE